MLGRFAGALAPFAPVLIGIILKFSLIDHPTGDLGTHFKATYVSRIWIDFIVTAYISGIAWFLTRQRVDTSILAVLIIVPLICFVICVLLTLGFVKAGIQNELLTLYLPAFVAAVSVSVAGNALAERT